MAVLIGSIGLRFTTLPDATPPSFQVPLPLSSSLFPAKGQPSQPPTTITALFNPMLGHMSGAYSAQVSRDLCLSSRFDFNVYSFESEWTMGTEWWIRRSSSVDASVDYNSSADPLPLEMPNLTCTDLKDEVHGVVKARASTNNVSKRLFRTIVSSRHVGYISDVGRSIAEYAR